MKSSVRKGQKMTPKVAKMLVKLHFRMYFLMFARCARERDFTKVGRVKPGWHGNGKRVSFFNAVYSEFRWGERG